MVSLHDDTPPVKGWNGREWADLHGETLEREPVTAEPMPDPLSTYTEAYLDIEEFRADHAEVFAAVASLERRLSTAEADLKAHACEVGNVANDTVTVTVSYPLSRTWDGAKLGELVPWLKTVPGLIATRIDVDGKKIDGLLKAGIVSESDIAEAMLTEQLTPRVSIRVRREANNVA